MVYGFIIPIYLVLGLEEKCSVSFILLFYYQNFSIIMLVLNTLVESAKTPYCDYLVVE
jgi:hypothetical protein